MNKNKKHGVAPVWMRRLVWANIAIQFSFPLAAAFTPVMVNAAQRHERFLQKDAEISLQTQVYILSAGESAASVAKKYNMSVDALRKLNQLRTFSRGFDNIKPGDELDVPLSPLPEVRWNEADNKTAIQGKNNDDMQARKLAGIASQAGTLANDINGDAASSMARSMATGAAGGEIQQWLSQFGTARVQLNADEKFSLKNSQIDLLVPAWERQDRLFFTQGSIHRTDDRNQANLGIGYRLFSDDWMLGGNTFLDYDLSRDHARMGLGVEYWRDYMKLGANSYLRLTNWKNSPDLEDYEERPANGWDVRAQGWIPALPQLGGKLVFEQYYGNEVALFGKENRQKNPHAVTAEVNYTPVPLLTLSARQRQGASGQNDTQFGLELNYQLGVPWQHQVNPDAVAAMRTLMGSRHDLVDRNNNIVLEYRKKEVITLRTADLVKGYSGEQKSLGVAVKSTHGLDHIDWSAPALLAAGGHIVQQGTSDYSVVLPGWQSGPDSVNNYTVSGVAVDTKGNRSKRSDTQVSVLAMPISLAHSSIVTDSTSYTVGSDMLVTVTLRGEANDVVTGQASALTGVTVQNATRKPGATWTDNGDGTYTTTYVANTIGTGLKASLSLSGQNGSVSSEAYTITSGVAVLANSSITTDSTSYVSGNDMTITVTLKDEDGHGVIGQAASLSGVAVQNATLKAGASWADNGDGTYTTTYVAQTVGSNLKASLTLSGQSSNVESAAYAITSGVAVAVNSTIATDSSSYISGSDMAITVTLKDSASNIVTGQAASLTGVAVQNATLKPGASWADNGDGTYTTTYVAQTTGSGLKASLSLSGTSVQSAAYAITSGTAVAANSTIATDSSSYASGSDMTIAVTLKDSASNGVTGLAASLTGVTVQNATLKPGANWTDNGDGTYTTTYVAQTTGSNLKASLTLSGTSVQSAAYAITAGTAVAANSAIATDSSSYISGSDMTITVTLKDTANNIVTGQASSLSGVAVQNATLKAGASWADNGDGTYTTTWVAQTSGTGLKASLTLNGSSVQSAAYAITAGTAVAANSAIATDSSSYASGDDMTITVTLKDTANNIVTGQAFSLSSVAVQNATLKAGASWADNGDGTYTTTYVAQTTGSGLKASLTLNGTSVQSAAYAITAGTAVAANSAIATDSSSYASGDDMTITVTLKDAANNAVIGQVSSLSSVAVQNATLKSGANWTDNGDGTYTTTYVAQTTGIGLKASLTLSGSSVQSAAYAITAGTAVAANSTIATDSSSYASGSDMTITVTLKDSASNSVTGQAASLTGVAVQNATLKSGASWADNGDGTYTTTYVAQTTGSGLKASLTLNGTSVQSAAYAITAGAAVAANSAIATDSSSYASGDDMTITVTLKDTANNAVIGQAASLTSVVVQNATLKAGANWADNGDGTYTTMYVAQTTGTGLQASLTLNGTSVQSAAYAITAGTAVAANSTIATDSSSYISGSDMTITVTLKDSASNIVTGQAASLTGVTVQNATLKPGASWADNGDGTYTTTWVAQTSGSGLQASLTLSGSSVQSAAYAITAGAAVAANSAIATDSSSYVSGDDMTITVTLKDSASNIVTGQAASLTGVAVQNATLKAGASWTDNGDGTYTTTYVAQTTGSNLKASLTLSGTTVQSAAYAITAGAAVAANSAIATDSSSYVYGDEMTVTVTLKDSGSNIVVGQAASLTGVTVQNATLKSGATWTDNSDGTYTTTYVAQTIGSGLKATLTLGGSSVQSVDYAITAGAAVLTNSAIAVDRTSYVYGDDMLITVTLKDAANNAATGQVESLTGVTVPNAILKSGATWTDNGDGTYTTTYMAETPNTIYMKASLTLAGQAGRKESQQYSISAGAPSMSKSTIAIGCAQGALLDCISGHTLSISITLNDAGGNPIYGYSGSALTAALTVPNTRASTIAWTSNGNTFTNVGWTLTTPELNHLKVSLNLDGEVLESEAYRVLPTLRYASISIDKSTYIVGDDILVTVSLTDGFGNPATGASSIVPSLVAIPTMAAELKQGTSWTDNGDGTYSATYEALTPASVGSYFVLYSSNETSYSRYAYFSITAP